VRTLTMQLEALQERIHGSHSARTSTELSAGSHTHGAACTGIERWMPLIALRALCALQERVVEVQRDFLLERTAKETAQETLRTMAEERSAERAEAPPTIEEAGGHGSHLMGPHPPPPPPRDPTIEEAGAHGSHSTRPFYCSQCTPFPLQSVSSSH
jgi:hypothetical protein